jgi:hypothetical protein
MNKVNISVMNLWPQNLGFMYIGLFFLARIDLNKKF